MENTESNESRTVSRRQFAAAVGAVGVGTFAGCSGDEAGPAGDGTDGNSSDDASVQESDGSTVELELFGYRQTGREIGVIARADGEPIDDAAVYLRTEDGSRGDPIGRTDAEGRLAFLVPDRETMVIEVVPDDREPAERSVDVLDSCQTVNHNREWFTTMESYPPLDEVDYNPHGYTTVATDGLFAPYARYDGSDGTFIPYLVADWTHEEDAMVATMREGITWENGDPVDAESLVFQWEILLETDHPASRILTGVSAADTYEVRFEYEPGTNPRAVEHAVLHERADHPPADWQPVHDGEVAPEELEVPEPTSSGPLVLTEVTDEYRQYEVRNALDDVPDFVPACGQYNFEGYRVRHVESTNDVHQAIIAGEIDGVEVFAGAETKDQFPKDTTEFSTPISREFGLWFNHDREPWNDRRVRRAFAHSFDRDRVVRDVDEPTTVTPDVQTGLLEPVATERLDDATRDDLTTYEYDPDRAESLLAEAGYELGSVEPTVPYVKSYAHSAIMTFDIVDQLGKVGWRPETNGVSLEEFRSIERSGEFDVLPTYHFTEQARFAPYFAYEHTLYGREGTPASHSGYATPDEGATVDVDDRTVDVRDRIEELERTTDADRRDEIVADLAHVVNEDLPYVQVAQRRSQTFLDERDLALPDESPHLNTVRPHWWLPLVQEELERAQSPGLLKIVRR